MEDFSLPMDQKNIHINMDMKFLFPKDLEDTTLLIMLLFPLLLLTTILFIMSLLLIMPLLFITPLLIIHLLIKPLVLFIRPMVLFTMPLLQDHQEEIVFIAGILGLMR